MKLKIVFSKNKKPLEIDYLNRLNGYLHSILGVNNEFHDKLSIYSTSFLQNSKITLDKKFLNFNEKCYWYVSSPDKTFLKRFIFNIQDKKNFLNGMILENVSILDNKFVSKDNKYFFKTLSPVLLKENINNKTVFYTFNDDKDFISNKFISILKKKHSNSNQNFEFDNNLKIYFNPSYKNKKIKKIKVKNIINTVSSCPIIVETNNIDTLNFLYDVGIGNSTGSGFGFLL